MRSIGYSYDGLLRLTEAAESPGAVYTYTYDLAGNRTSAWVDSLLVQSASYNDANQVVGWTYDAAGNLIDDDVVSYTYDALNRQVTRDSTNYFYNGDGVLVGWDDGSLTRYVQDLASPLPVILDDGAAQYVYGHERLFGDDGSDRTWYLGDALGSVRMTLDAAGVPLAGLNYDPWGTPQSTTIAPFGFTGEPQDTAGNVYLRARWYTPGRGTFGSRDPFEGYPELPYSLQYYQYSYSAPTTWTDHTGAEVDCEVTGSSKAPNMGYSCLGGQVINWSSSPIRIAGAYIKQGCNRQEVAQEIMQEKQKPEAERYTETNCIIDNTARADAQLGYHILYPGESSEDYGYIDTDGVSVITPDLFVGSGYSRAFIERHGSSIFVELYDSTWRYHPNNFELAIVKDTEWNDDFGIVISKGKWIDNVILQACQSRTGVYLEIISTYRWLTEAYSFLRGGAEDTRAWNQWGLGEEITDSGKHHVP